MKSAAAWKGVLGAFGLVVLLCSVLPSQLFAAVDSKPATAPAASRKSSAKKKRSPTAHSNSAALLSNHSKSKRGTLKTTGRKFRGQQKIDPQRAQAIQEALIREHYMTGEPAGTWNQDSEQAMRRYQADHGWQSKTVPDSRALISLGLGPNHDHLLNPESAMMTGPAFPGSASVASSPQIPASHSAQPASQAPTLSSGQDQSTPQ